MSLGMAVRMGDMFEELDREYEQATRKVELNDVVRGMLEEFKSLHSEKKGKMYAGGTLKFYQGRVRSYRAGDITALSLLLRQELRQEDVEKITADVGVYLTALVNRCEEQKVTLYNGKYIPESPIREGNIAVYIGRMNKDKNIIVRGDALEVGSFMRGGHIIVEGNALGVGTGMSGGLIEINGNGIRSTEIGTRMAGGEIRILGNSDYKPNVKCVGAGMKGGVIRINGEVAKFPQFAEGGDIYHDGVLVVKDGRIVKT